MHVVVLKSRTFGVPLKALLFLFYWGILEHCPQSRTCRIGSKDGRWITRIYREDFKTLFWDGTQVVGVCSVSESRT